MAMDFWEAQRRARVKTAIYLTIFVVLSVIMSVCVEMGFRILTENYDGPPIAGPLFLLITLSVAGYQYSMFSLQGGSYVAESVGAFRVLPDTRNAYERSLLNIVDEVAIASSLPVPPVYIIPAQEINAFAAGVNSKNAVIAVTEGALRKLNRDELQGVIAHEFGHIANGDMKISMRLAAMVMGFMFILYFGMRMIQFSRFQPRDSKKGGNPVAAVALMFLIAGAVTWLFGSILKACVSRQREYLADASAVQYTRNSAIADALRKIGKDSVKDMPASGMAFSHMYLDNHHSFNSLFATHPPLAKRIAAIEDTVANR
jgi:heat shock protein HtpX